MTSVFHLSRRLAPHRRRALRDPIRHSRGERLARRAGRRTAPGPGLWGTGRRAGRAVARIWEVLVGCLARGQDPKNEILSPCLTFVHAQ